MDPDQMASLENSVDPDQLASEKIVECVVKNESKQNM